MLTPSDVSISEYLGTHETQFADLYAALVLEGLENALECKRKKREKFITSMDLFSCDFCIWHFFSAGTFTIFAPQDSAFAQILANLPSITADDSYFKSTFDPYSSKHFETYNSISIYFDNTSVLTLYKFEFLTEILTYHVVPGVWFSSGLTDGMSLPTLAGSNITISLQGSGNECFRRGK